MPALDELLASYRSQLTSGLGGDEDLVTDPRTGRLVRRKDLDAIQETFRNAPVGLGEGPDPINDVGIGELAGKSVLRNVIGPIVGLGERVGLAREGSTEKIRQTYEGAREDFLAQDPSDPVRAAGAAALEGLTNVVPLVPAQTLGRGAASILGRVAPKLVQEGGLAAKAIAGAVPGMAEGALVGFGDTAGEDAGTSALATGASAAIGGLFGARGGLGADLPQAFETAASRFIDKYFGPSGAPVHDSAIAAVRLLNRQFFDSHAAIERIAKTTGNPRDLKEARELVQVMRSSPGLSQAPVIEGTRRYLPNGDIEVTGEPFIDIAEKGLDSYAAKRVAEGDARKYSIVRQEVSKDFKAFLGAQRTVDLAKRSARNETLGGSKITIDKKAVIDAEAALADIETRHGEGFKDLAARYRDWSVRAFLDPLRDVGVFDEKQYRDILDSGEYYAPLHRALDLLYDSGVKLEEETGQRIKITKPRTGPRSGEGGKPIARITSGPGEAPELLRKDIFEASIEKAIQVDRFAARQRVRNFVGELAEAPDGHLTGVFRATRLTSTKVTREEFEAEARRGGSIFDASLKRAVEGGDLHIGKGISEAGIDNLLGEAASSVPGGPGISRATLPDGSNMIAYRGPSGTVDAMASFRRSDDGSIIVDQLVRRGKNSRAAVEVGRELGKHGPVKLTGIMGEDAIKFMRGAHKRGSIGLEGEPPKASRQDVEAAVQAGEFANITRTVNVENGTFSVWRDGKRYTYRGDSDLLRAMSFMDPGHIPVISDIGRAATKILKAGATGLNVAFGQRNLVRDQFNLGIFTRNGVIPVYDPLVSLAQQIAAKIKPDSVLGQTPFARGAKEIVEEFNRSPAAFAALVSLDMIPDTLEKQVARISKDLGRSNLSRVMHTIANPLRVAQIINEAGERASRLSEFRLARRGGRKELFKTIPIPLTTGGSPKSIREAGLDAADVTLNFTRGGTTTKMWSQYEAFANPEFQDISRFGREVATRPFQVLMKTFAYVTLPAIAHWYSHQDDPGYQNQNEWEKRAFLKVGETEDGSPIRIPRPIGIVNLLGGYMVEKLLDHWVLQDPKAVGEFVDAMMQQTPLHFVDVRQPQNLVDLLPNAVQPLAEVGVNFDPFADREIEPLQMQNLAPEDRSFPSTSQTAREVGLATGQSPLNVEHLIGGYGAGLSRDLVQGGEQLIGAPRRPATSIKDNPALKLTGVSGFLGRKPIGFGSEPVTQLYELAERATQIAGSLKKATDEGNAARELQIRRESPEYVVDKMLRSVKEELSDLRKAEDQVVALYQNKKMGEQEANDAILRIRERITQIAILSMDTANKEIDRARSFWENR